MIGVFTGLFRHDAGRPLRKRKFRNGLATRCTSGVGSPVPFGGKKQTIKLANDAMPVAGGIAMVAIPGVGAGRLGETPRPTVVAPSASHRLSDGDHVFTAGDVSQAFTVAGKKWNVLKQNKRAEVDPNPTGLKLAFTEKTGVVKGTFTVVDGKAKTKYTVVGAVVGGKFYGSAYVRKAVPIPATAE